MQKNLLLSQPKPTGLSSAYYQVYDQVTYKLTGKRLRLAMALMLVAFSLKTMQNW